MASNDDAFHSEAAAREIAATKIEQMKKKQTAIELVASGHNHDYEVAALLVRCLRIVLGVPRGVGAEAGTKRARAAVGVLVLLLEAGGALLHALDNAPSKAKAEKQDADSIERTLETMVSVQPIKVVAKVTHRRTDATATDGNTKKNG